MFVVTNSKNERMLYGLSVQSKDSVYQAKRCYDNGLIPKSLYMDYLRLSNVVYDIFDTYMSERGHDMS